MLVYRKVWNIRRYRSYPICWIDELSVNERFGEKMRQETLHFVCQCGQNLQNYCVSNQMKEKYNDVLILLHRAFGNYLYICIIIAIKFGSFYSFASLSPRSVSIHVNPSANLFSFLICHEIFGLSDCKWRKAKGEKWPKFRKQFHTFGSTHSPNPSDTVNFNQHFFPRYIHMARSQ